ncbi:apolipoprotein N-acyltransferase [Thiobacter aerophilum]|uniref:Apolipoprotein N-acyltransferase n=1 Tax=Thiobacter aerophilum TaxID=3121275 RepID=A0ABV0EIX9_9BURK
MAGLRFAPHNLWPATLLGLAGLLALLARQRRPLGAAIVGGVFGLALFMPSLWWLFSGVDRSQEPVLALLGPLALIAGLSSLPAAVAALVGAARLPLSLRLTVLAPALWVSSEWLRHQGALAFPWLTVGYAQVPDGPLAGFAPLLGILGVSLATMVCAGWLAWAAVARQSRTRVAAVAVVVLVLVAGAAAGRIEWTTPSGKSVTAALLQGNAPMREKFSPEDTARALRTYGALAARSEAALVIMPETAFPLFEHQLPAGFQRFLEALAWARQGDMLVSYFRRRAEGTPYDYVSSTRSLGVSGNQVYDKQHLLPFGEFIPFARWLRPLYERMAKVRMLDTSPGAPHPGDLVLAGTRIALRMCYEDVFGNERREAVAQSQLLVTLVNDSWDGATAPMDQHLQISQARALEAGKPLLRAANTGWTVAIDHHGHVLDALPPQTVASLITRVEPRTGSTPYVLAGDALPMSLVALGLMVCALAETRARASARAGA